MYHQHFGLIEPPFSLTPDTGYFYNYASHREALNTLLVAISMGEGFIKITGEVGSGKTLLCRTLLQQLDDDIVTAYIPNPMMSATELNKALADELGIELQSYPDPHKLLKSIYEKLRWLRLQRKKVVLLIDEAQAMPEATLESLRLLTNLETEKYKLLQVVLLGQPELDEKLNCPSIRQLKQRITFSYCLSLLDKRSIEDYIGHRLNIAGYNGARLFSQSAMKMLIKASHGTPRIINTLCHKALMVAYGQGAKHIDKQHMHSAIQDSECTNTPFFTNAAVADVAISLCLLTGIGLILMGVMQ